VNEVRGVGDRVAELLRGAGDGARSVAGLDWTIAELGAHLVTVARRNLRIAAGEPIAWAPGDDPHASMAAYNDAEIASLGEDSPARLADALVDANGALLEACADGERLLDWPGYRARAHDSLGVWLGELLVHGLDLARTCRQPWAIRAEQAAAVFDGLVPALPVFADPRAARRATGTYGVHLRGDGRYEIRVDGEGAVSVARGAPGRADLHLSARPVTYLLLGYGRLQRWRALASGGVVAWGRRPWLALRFGDLFAAP
jgi:hypothetical protein